MHHLDADATPMLHIKDKFGFDYFAIFTDWR